MPSFNEAWHQQEEDGWKMEEAEILRKPYAPWANLQRVISLHRDGRLPHQLSQGELVRLGIPQGNSFRTFHALQFLNLVDREGKRTEKLTLIAHASTVNYQQELAQIVLSAYYDVFHSIGDLSKADSKQLESAFCHAFPSSQHKRMIHLFLHLCQESGLLTDTHFQNRERKQATLLLDRLIQQIPTRCRWTKKERERWLQAVSASIDLLIEVEEGSMSP